MQCEELLAREDTPPEARQQVEVIRRKVDSMAGMVSQLLLLSRADQGREKLALEELDLSELSELVAQEFAELAGEKGIALAADIQPGVAITGDQTLLLRLWGNLLQNAVTYGKEGGHIWMKLSAGEGVATLQVRDDGVGFDVANTQGNRYFVKCLHRKIISHFFALYLANEIMRAPHQFRQFRSG